MFSILPVQPSKKWKNIFYFFLKKDAKSTFSLDKDSNLNYAVIIV